MNNFATLLKLLVSPSLAGGNNLIDDYERTFAKTVLNCDLPTLAFWRGRVALWTILQAAGLKKDDEVIVPAYTCEMVPAAVKFAGGRCIYVDVDVDSYNPSVGQIVDVITDRTRAIICQHTYGTTQSVQQILSHIDQRPITIIEDCCHLVTNCSNHNANVPVGDAAFFSTQWSKPYSTGLGGMAVFSNQELYNASRQLQADFTTSRNRKRAFSLVAQVLIHGVTVRPSTKPMIARLYRWAQHAGLITGTTSPQEYEKEMPDDYLVRAVNAQAVIGKKQLEKWQENVKHRQMLTGFYLSQLKENGIDTNVLKTTSNKPILWAVPIFIENVDEILRQAQKAALPLESWFGPAPVHLAEDTAEMFDYKMGQCPRSERLVEREVHFLTSPEVTLKKAQKAIEFIQQYANIVKS